MDKALKTKWIKALRSGKYDQAKEILRSPESGAMCCLGVLATIQDCPSSKLDDVQKWTLPKGFNAGLPLSARIRLARMNDGENDRTQGITDIDHPHSFAEIADYIKANL